MRRFRALASTIAISTLALVTACGSQTSPGAGGGPSGDSSLDGAWQLTAGALDGKPLDTAAGPVTLDIDRSAWTGRSACNSYFADVAGAGDNLTVGPVGGTEMGCAEPAMTLEGLYWTALQRVTGASRTADSLTLTGDGVTLQYSPAATVTPADLVGTAWTLGSLLEGDTASSVIARPATLTLRPDGRVVGSTGCRSFRGRWEQSGDQIRIDSLATTRIACKGAAAPQDRHVLTVLSGTVSVRLDGRTLTVQNGSVGLAYAAP